MKILLLLIALSVDPVIRKVPCLWPKYQWAVNACF
jgi:hypothetical protein